MSAPQPLVFVLTKDCDMPKCLYFEEFIVGERQSMGDERVRVEQDAIWASMYDRGWRSIVVPPDNEWKFFCPFCMYGHTTTRVVPFPEAAARALKIRSVAGDA